MMVLLSLPRQGPSALDNKRKPSCRHQVASSGSGTCPTIARVVCEDRDMPDIAVRRVDFGYFVRPPAETGTGQPRVDACLGYVVDHPQGVLLFDTGMGAHPEVDAYYRPRRVGLHAALATAGVQTADLSVAANCHLHFDHCGGNPLLGPIPVFVQTAELDAALRTPDYTLPELIEASRFEQVTGEVEVLPGVFLMPTPGHTDGHQSLVVRRADGAVILAGQTHDTATQYAADQLAWRGRRDGHSEPLPDIPAWLDALQHLDPRVVYFAHDRSVWTP
jgi:N-acyl homoserine lactone hydrolase